MTESPTTRVSLLVRLRDPQDREAWAQFVDLYAPLVYGFARKRGLQDADAADLTQVVLRAVSAAAGRLEYDPQRGSFRGWLFTIVRNRLRNFLAARRPGLNQGSGDEAVQRLLEAQEAPQADPAQLWEQEWERQLFAWAAAQLKPRFHEATWQAFWQTAVEGRRPLDVARALGVNQAAVYLARSRVMARLRELIRHVEDD
jgi:RNA polymerase sigma-70 factor (ECF subfamily)